ncbi:unnamed protein product [Chondrus crispus]|uniref:Carboxymethylenebutenolidase homolog n=1 Tax=Chondrus crispus TaxID=2769 RepID=R7QF11_CHOCR|nr:unnamed protein product [Chondrus crispus]CDF36368.1 unnamed protein product [Chondrus crispus]|eukprot:XP_005716187.1 unnamed protein product [Chondrus crispus]
MGTPSAVVEELQLHASDGATVAAFLVRSQPHRPSRTAVVLMTDILGYENHETRAVAMLLAAHGFTTIVPDLFRGNPWVQGRDKSEYESWRRTHDPATVRGDILLARQALTERSLGTSLGLVGFCFGGGRLMEEVALNTSGLNPDAAVAFYPTRFDPEDVGRNAHCPLLVQTGDRDDLVPVYVVNTLRETLQANASVKEWNVEVYEGFGHAFAHHPSSEADKAQSEVAFARALAWLKRHL